MINASLNQWRRAIVSKVAYAIGLAFWITAANANGEGCSMTETKGIGGPRLELEEAVKNLDFDKVSNLLADGVDPNAKGALQRTALHYAARLGPIAIVEMLIDHGADVNARDNAGYTPLHRAVQSGDSTIVEVLIKSGAMRSAATKTGDTPISLAREYGFNEMEKALSAENDTDL